MIGCSDSTSGINQLTYSNTWNFDSDVNFYGQRIILFLYMLLSFYTIFFLRRTSYKDVSPVNKPLTLRKTVNTFLRFSLFSSSLYSSCLYNCLLFLFTKTTYAACLHKVCGLILCWQPHYRRRQRKHFTRCYGVRLLVSLYRFSEVCYFCRIRVRCTRDTVGTGIVSSS